MRHTIVCTFLALALSLSAAFVSFQLLAKHLTGAPGPSWFDAGCSDDPASGANCSAVLASPYSYWPVKKEGEPEGTRHWPVALFGMFYYSALAVWFMAVGRPSYRRRLVHLLPLAFVACGLIGSAYFVYVMFTKLQHWCVWCLVTHGINLSIAVLLVLMWPRKPKLEAVGATNQNGGGAERTRDVDTRVHPSMRLIAIGVLAALAVVWGQYQLYDKGRFVAVARNNQNAFTQCVQMVNKLKANPSNLLAAWERAPTCSIPLRPDDPARTDAAPGEPTMTVVVFSDLECPSCKRFAIFFERDIQPLFDNKLTLIYRHHPLDTTCNPRIARTMHPHACEAAKMAEAARFIGGVEKFWLAHDYLFNYQSDLDKGTLTPEWLAEKIGVDPNELRTRMESAEVAARISQDIEEAGHCDVHATPTVYVDGKLVETIPRTEIGFWDLVADKYWSEAGLPRPARTKLNAKAAIPNSQGRKAGP